MDRAENLTFQRLLCECLFFHGVKQCPSWAPREGDFTQQVVVVWGGEGL
jgi:hypothetical protein